jgi:Tfp pilus assembly protein PilX
MRKRVSANDRGMALIVALIMLLVLTLIGINAITTTTFETSISGNERVSADAFYASEAGIQVGLNQIPETNPISRTKLGEDSYYRSQIEARGPFLAEGYGSNWQFDRFQVNATGESFRAIREIEVQVKYGPFPGGTGYDN